MENKELLELYTKMYNNVNVSNPYLRTFVHLSTPTRFLFWLYFTAFTFVNVPILLSILGHCCEVSETSPIVGFMMGCVIADFISGIVHIYLDNSRIKHDGSPTDFLRLGFQVHHLYPQFQWTQNKHFQPHYEANTIFFMNIIVSVINVATFRSNTLFFVLSLTLLMQANHYWCHAISSNKKVPFVVKWLQSCGILLYYKTHMKHHTTYDSSFCLLLGWCDPIFNYMFQNKPILNAFINVVDSIT